MTFVPAHEIVESERARPARTVLFAHGILGSRRNWRGFAQRFVDARQDWRAVLVDLRHHGDSVPAPGPSTVAQCAADLESLAAEVGEADWVVGHSFGGRVALALAESARPRRAVVLDSPPAEKASPTPARPGTAWSMVAQLREVPLPLPSRQDLVERMRALGYSEAVARWMTTNLERADDGYTWRFDLDGVEALMADYAATDHWHVLEEPPPGTRVDVIRGARSDVWDAAALARLEALEESGRIGHYTLDAGHWLHMDDPDGLLDRLVQLADEE